MRWGLPSAAGRLLVNARSETVARLPAFRDGFAQRRCLIPADGFYEWQKSGARKQPYFIHRPGDQPFAFAGIWQPGPDGPTAECLLLTQAAGDSMRPIHDRQPVRLAPESWDLWLSQRSRLIRPRSRPCWPCPRSTIGWPCRSAILSTAWPTTRRAASSRSTRAAERIVLGDPTLRPLSRGTLK